MINLRNVLLVNGVSSGATGLLLLAFARFFSNLFQVNSSDIFAGVGIFLIAFAAFVILVALKNATSVQIRAIIVLDIAWVTISLLVVAIDYSKISMIGIVLIIAVAGWVAAMAFLQTRGLRQVTL